MSSKRKRDKAGTKASAGTGTSTSTVSISRWWLPLWAQRTLLALSIVYLACVWLDATNGSKIDPYLRQPFRFFVQVAQLFPRAAENTIEWRVEGYRCADGHFEELDVSPYFPIHADDKESRLDRAMHFFRNDNKILKLLARYIRKEESALGPDHAIGGVMLLSLRWPLPPIADHASELPYRRLPLAQVPREIERHYWYVTNESEREKNCATP